MYKLEGEALARTLPSPGALAPEVFGELEALVVLGTWQRGTRGKDEVPSFETTRGPKDKT